MKTPKLLTLLLTIATLFSAAAHAQDKSTPPAEGRRGKGGESQRGGQMMSPEARVEQLDKAVSLTEEQKTKIKDIYAKSQEELRTAMRGSGGDRDAARQKMMEMMRATRDQVRALLTDEQKKKFDAMPQRGGGDQGGRGKGKRDGKTQ
jgi:periplasmic protein CpxP/Spy